MQHTTYHSLLRVSSLVCVCVLTFQSGLFADTTRQLADQSFLFLGNTSVGISASVTPTELNTYTAALTQREQELNAREATINERELSIGLNADGSQTYRSELTTYLLSTLLFIILVLMILNYILDFRRQRYIQSLVFQQNNQAIE